MTKFEIVFQECEKAFLAEEERTNNLAGKTEKLILALAAIMGFNLISDSFGSLENTLPDGTNLGICNSRYIPNSCFMEFIHQKLSRLPSWQ